MSISKFLEKKVASKAKAKEKQQQPVQYGRHTLLGSLISSSR